MCVQIEKQNYSYRTWAIDVVVASTVWDGLAPVRFGDRPYIYPIWFVIDKPNKDFCVCFVFQIVPHVGNMTIEDKTPFAKLKKFSCDMLTPNHAIAIIDKRQNGSSVLAHHLMQHLPNAETTVISPASAAVYRDLAPQACIHQEFNENIVTDVLESQRACKGSSETKALIVLDECMYDKSQMSSKAFENLVYNGRCFLTGMILCVQTSLGLAPGIRNNLDWVFVFRAGRDDIGRLHKQFGTGLSFNEFDAVFQQITADKYSCVVIHNTPHLENAIDAFYWYKVDLKADLESQPDTAIQKSTEKHRDSSEPVLE